MVLNLPGLVFLMLGGVGEAQLIGEEVCPAVVGIMTGFSDLEK